MKITLNKNRHRAGFWPIVIAAISALKSMQGGQQQSPGEAAMPQMDPGSMQGQIEAPNVLTAEAAAAPAAGTPATGPLPQGSIQQNLLQGLLGEKIGGTMAQFGEWNNGAGRVSNPMVRPQSWDMTGLLR